MNNRTKFRVTIYDIAKLSETSPSTVSLVLNDRWTEHRITQETADRIRRNAAVLGYAANPRARALRLSRSGLAGMIVPHYRNRLFTGLVEAFEAQARARNLCPLVASTQRDPRIEAEAVQSLLRQDVEFLCLAGITEPEPLVRACKAAGVQPIGIDLPVGGAPSVVTDNHHGTRQLTESIIARMRQMGHAPEHELYFIGGIPGEYATVERLSGFLETAGRPFRPGTQDFLCGYDSDAAYACLEKLHADLGRLPKGLLLNSTPVFEAAARFLISLDRAELADTTFGCFDWVPLGEYFPGLVGMVRHDTARIIDAAFEIAGNYDVFCGRIIRIRPELSVTKTTGQPRQ